MIRRSLIALASLLVLVVVGVAVAGVMIVRKPFPQADGTVDLPGLRAEVTVQRDAQGVPHIYAQTSADLFRAQGYVHAQDRFFEMDYRRHVTAGRLSELVGNNPDAISADRVIRTFGWRKVAEQEWDLITQESRDHLTAYAQGVNAYLESRSTTDLGLEYTVLGVQVDVADPEPWDPIDSLAWLKAMAWDLRGNYDDELDRALVYSTVGDVAKVEELFPPYADAGNAPILDAAARTSGGAGTSVGGGFSAGGALTAPPTLAAPAPADARTPPGPLAPSDTDAPAVEAPAVDAPSAAAAISAAHRALDAVPHTVAQGEGTGSNSWVVSGAHTATGKPMLANDPHLALSAPSIWSQVGLHCTEKTAECQFDVSGFSFSGFPGVVIGHNADLAWGLTNLGADVTDFFVEAIRDDQYLYDGEWLPITVRSEVVRINGGQDLTVEVRETVHGPLVSSELGETVAALRTPSEDAPRGTGYGVALSWTALTPGRTADAVFALNRAADAADVAAAAALFEVPSQNIVFATTSGDIGYQAPGKIPVRTKVDGPVPSDGSWPRPGWDAAYDWQGFVEPADMPAALNPSEGFIVAANQAVLPGGQQPFLTTDWDYGYRSQRIRALLEGQIAAGTPLTVESMAAMQADDWSPYADLLLPALLDQELDDEFAAEGQELLRDWDETTGKDSAGAAYFNAVWGNLLQATFWDDLPELVWPDGGSTWLTVVADLLEDPTSPWWDDRTTVNVVETRDEILGRALVDARLDLTRTLGKDPKDWKWGRLHRLELEHPVLGGDSIPAPVRALVNPRSVGMPGGSSIVNATAWDASTWDPVTQSRSFAVTAGPSMRMVVDLADLDASRWVVVSGTSGHPGHPHYADQLGTWADGENYPWEFSRQAVDAATKDTLTLRPAE